MALFYMGKDLCDIISMKQGPKRRSPCWIDSVLGPERELIK
jgi:hypothetical protein